MTENITFEKPKVVPPFRLGRAFYENPDVVAVAQALIGKVLVTDFEGGRSSGRITETEAYRAPDDRACHAYGDRRTARTAVMFEPGGRAYVYLCYGLHHLFNIVTGPAESAQAVLIRSIEPLDNVDVMLQRRNFSEKRRHDRSLTTGPGALTQALGIRTTHTGHDLLAPEARIWVEDDGFVLPPTGLGVGTRIGVDYAGTCALRPWRFWLEGSRYRK